LSRDQAKTDVNGIASVTLTAGQAEAQFKVSASAVNAPDAEFQIAVSKLDFVELDAQLAWPGAAMLRALLYDDKSCAALPASPMLPPPSRALSKAADTATLGFVNLLSKDYALVGRAEDASGRLVGYGCVDVGAGLLPPGSASTVPLPLAAVVPVATGAYTLTSTLAPAPAKYQTLLSRWQQLGGGCPYGAAQLLLDTMGITSHRDAPLANGCRPTSTTSPMSLDRQLQDLLTASPTAPANALPALADDLGAITASTTLQSTLTVTRASADGYTAAHALTSATFAAGGQQKTYDLVALGQPVIAVKDVALVDAGGALKVSAHGFTFGWTTLWELALVDLSIPLRVGTVTAPPIEGLVKAVVAPASRNGKMGCAAVDDLVCSVTTGAPGCSLTTPCASAVTPMAATLEAPFAATTGIDLTLAGTATAVDSDGDLQVDLLSGGSWSAPGLAPSTFSGTVTP
jgi:hypothetical protein